VEATSAAEAFRILEEALKERLEQRLLPHPAVRHALGSFARTAHTASIAEVREAVGLSHRRFVEVFTRAVGLAPKPFCRLQRFQRVVRLAHRRRRIRWSEVAIACGYSDQSHLNHDFRAFSGLTPTDWASSRTVFANHVRI
jgi:AraC-like DNA-binding protein